MKRLCVAIAVSFFILPISRASAAVIFAENFDGGPPGFTSPDAGLWHVTQNNPFSSPNALGFVTGETAGATPNGNFNGNRNNAVFSPLISIPVGATDVTLTFAAANYMEGGTFFDRLSVFAAPTNTSLVNATLLASSSPASNSGFDAGGIQIPNNDGYNLISVDLSALSGQSFYLAFNYRTVDSVANNYPGARVDDVAISATLAPVPEPATLAVFGALAAGAFGLRRRLKPVATA